MLDVTLAFLGSRLNTHLRARIGKDDCVQVGPVAAQDGTWAVPQDHVGLSVLCIEEERTLRSQLPEHSYVDGRNVVLEPDLKLNLHVLFAANFQVYDEALKAISHVLLFFQAHSAFTPERDPALDARIQRISVELQSLSYEQLNQVWNFLGAKHLPSVVYRVRMLVLQDLEPAGIGVPITQISAGFQSR